LSVTRLRGVTDMKVKTLGRHTKEGVKNLGRNGWMTFASVSAVTVTLLLVGVFLILLLNLNAVASQIEEDVEIRVYLDRTLEEENYEGIEQKINEISEVQSVDFLSKEQGLSDFIESLGDQGRIFASLKDENPLRDAFIVKTTKPQDTEGVAKEIQTFENINSDDVRYGQGTVEKLFQVTGIARNIGTALILGLLFTAMFLIANTIKLTIISRGKEIEIMKLVGATNGFIRWPFFIEGFFLGVLGSFVPIVCLFLGYKFTYNAVISNYEIFFVNLLPIYPLMFQLSGLLVVLGAVIGVWGSLTSVRKFLRV
jgi:cell division transport system permease protein